MLYGIEHIRLGKLRFKVGTSCQDEASDVHLVVGNEHLGGYLCHFTHIVVSLLHT